MKSIVEVLGYLLDENAITEAQFETIISRFLIYNISVFSEAKEIGK